MTSPRRVFLAASLIAAAALVTGCVVHTPVPQARVRRGPAFDASLKKILALPTDCSAGEDGLCTTAQGLAVDSSARMSLEFAGLRLVDSEVVNTYLRERVTIARTSGSASSTRSEVDSEDATWATTTVERRRELMKELGIDGYMQSLITVGEVKNLEGQRTITVTVTITRAADAALAWSSKCSVETGRFYFADEAVDVAAKCALESALMVGS